MTVSRIFPIAFDPTPLLDKYESAVAEIDGTLQHEAVRAGMIVHAS